MRGAYTAAACPVSKRRPEDFVPARHPLRAIREMAKVALAELGLLSADQALERWRWLADIALAQSTP